MSESEEAVGREKGFLVMIEPASGPASLERAGYSIKDVAKLVIDEFDYFMSNDVMYQVTVICAEGGAASVELATPKGAMTLTIFEAARGAGK